MAQLVVACALPIHAVLEAFRTGEGFPYADYGADLHEGQARFTQPLFDNLLASDWFPAVPTIHDRLNGDPPARVADLGCGLGRSSIAIARGYPKVTVDGIDLDQASIERAQQLVPTSGVEDRVEFQCREAADPDLLGRYNVVTIFEALHDMSYPVDVLRAARGMLSDGGCALIGDEKAAERFALDAGDVERLAVAPPLLMTLDVALLATHRVRVDDATTVSSIGRSATSSSSVGGDAGLTRRGVGYFSTSTRVISNASLKMRPKRLRVAGSDSGSQRDTAEQHASITLDYCVE